MQQTDYHLKFPTIVKEKIASREFWTRDVRRCKINGAEVATIALAGAEVGIGNVFSSLIHSIAWNPSLAEHSVGYTILGFALTKAIASTILNECGFWG